MRILIFMFLFCCLGVLSCFAQKTVITSGEAQVELTDDKSRKEVKEKAFELAVRNALEKEFGTTVTQSNATYLSNINSGEKTETMSTFHMIANTLVKGEVDKILKEEYNDVTGYKVVNGEQKQLIEIKCEVTVQAR